MSLSSEAQFVSVLSESGFPIWSVETIREQYDPLPSSLAELLLEWIPRLEDRRLQELAAPKGT